MIAWNLTIIGKDGLCCNKLEGKRGNNGTNENWKVVGI